MISFSNGHKFTFMAASGALAFDGRGWPWEWPLRWLGLLDPRLFTIVIKTLTRHPRRGNLRWTHPWSVMRTLSGGGVVNAIGLTNPGIENWTQGIAPKIPDDYNFVVSIEADDEVETLEMLRMLAGQKALGVELNLSCPNVAAREERTTEKMISLCRRASNATPFPLIAKLSYTHDYVAVAKELSGMKAFQAVAINSIPWAAMFPKKPSPLARFGGGGVSGKLIQPHTWKMVREIAEATTLPIVAPSIWEYDDIDKALALGAKAVSFGSLFVQRPWRPTLLVRRWNRVNQEAT